VAFALTGLIVVVALVLWLRAPETLPSGDSHPDQ
jgi:hypothetical protein